MRLRADLTDPYLVAGKFVVTEIDYGKLGHPSFFANMPFVEWEAVKMQMLFVHGCARITRSDA